MFSSLIAPCLTYLGDHPILAFADHVGFAGGDHQIRSRLGQLDAIPATRALHSGGRVDLFVRQKKRGGGR